MVNTKLVALISSIIIIVFVTTFNCGCGSNGSSESGSSYAGAITAPADRIDYVNTNYVKVDVSTPVNAKAIFTGESEPVINAVFRNASGTDTTILMNVDTSVITTTLKDGDWTNGEAVKTADYVLPIGSYDFKINASRAGATASTGWCTKVTSLSANAKAALDIRLAADPVYPLSVGMSYTALAPAKGEADELLSWIANSGNEDIVAKKVRDELYRLDSTGAILNNGTPRTFSAAEYDLLLRYKFNSLINRRVAAQTQTLAPVLNAYITDDEVPDKFNGGSLNKFASQFIVKREDMNNIQVNSIWALDSEALNVFNKAFATSLADTYNKNVTYTNFDGQGYQLIW